MFRMFVSGGVNSEESTGRKSKKKKTGRGISVVIMVLDNEVENPSFEKWRMRMENRSLYVRHGGHSF